MNEINHECYVSLDTAKLLKKAGFDWECRGYFDGIEFHPNGSVECTNYNSNACKYLKVPTLDVAQRWLRENKGYYIAWEFNMNIGSCGQELYDFTDISVYIFVDSEQGNICKCKLKENYKTIEEAQESGIKKALEIL